MEIKLKIYKKVKIGHRFSSKEQFFQVFTDVYVNKNRTKVVIFKYLLQFYDETHSLSIVFLFTRIDILK